MAVFKRVRVGRRDIQKFSQKEGIDASALQHLVINFDHTGKVAKFAYRGRIRAISAFALRDIFNEAFSGRLGERIDNHNVFPMRAVK